MQRREGTRRFDFRSTTWCVGTPDSTPTFRAPVVLQVVLRVWQVVRQTQKAGHRPASLLVIIETT